MSTETPSASKSGPNGTIAARESIRTEVPLPIREAIQSWFMQGSRRLKDLYAYFRPEHILDQIALYEGLPDEIKLKILKEFALDQHSSIYLRTKQKFDNLVAKDLKHCKSATRKALKPLLEEAILTTSLVRLDIIYEHRLVDGRDSLVAKAPQDLVELAQWIRSLELRFYVELNLHDLSEENHAPAFIPKIDAGMILARELQNLRSIDVHLCFIHSVQPGEDPDALPNAGSIYTPDLEYLAGPTSTKMLVAEALERIKENTSEKRKGFFKLSVYRQGARSAKQSDSVIVRQTDDLSATIAAFIPTVKDVEFDEPDMDSVLAGLASPSGNAWQDGWGGSRSLGMGI